jgi:lipoyl(octanoyl) transferase
LKLKRLGEVDYLDCWHAMKHFTDGRDPDTEDELWLLQHPPVFTQGQAGRAEHVLTPGDVPLVQSDRGGQVTYHGPGQWVVYLLIDLRRRKLGVRDLVDLIEDSVVELLSGQGIEACTRRDAPGVYVGASKIASLGLRIRRGCSYHGLALNVDMDLEPFSRINPCGFQGLAVTSIRECLGESPDMNAIGESLLAILGDNLCATTGGQSAYNPRSPQTALIDLEL